MSLAGRASTAVSTPAMNFPTAEAPTRSQVLTAAAYASLRLRRQHHQPAFRHMSASAKLACRHFKSNCTYRGMQRLQALTVKQL